tara:strand:- start:1995 stop:2219 length:225 start_codon:yes stop_codon:yes gene_type:complete
MEEGMLILEAKDMAADKMDSKKKEDKEEDGDLLSDLADMVDSWDDEDHQYYADVVALVQKHGGEVEEEEEEFYD